jgi:hypothetical protein
MKLLDYFRTMLKVPCWVPFLVRGPTHPVDPVLQLVSFIKSRIKYSFNFVLFFVLSFVDYHWSWGWLILTWQGVFSI